MSTMAIILISSLIPHTDSWVSNFLSVYTSIGPPRLASDAKKKKEKSKEKEKKKSGNVQNRQPDCSVFFKSKDPVKQRLRGL